MYPGVLSGLEPPFSKESSIPSSPGSVFPASCQHNPRLYLELDLKTPKVDAIHSHIHMRHRRPVGYTGGLGYAEAAGQFGVSRLFLRDCDGCDCCCVGSVILILATCFDLFYFHLILTIHYVKKVERKTQKHRGDA